MINIEQLRRRAHDVNNIRLNKEHHEAAQKAEERQKHLDLVLQNAEAAMTRVAEGGLFEVEVTGISHDDARYIEQNLPMGVDTSGRAGLTEDGYPTWILKVKW